MLDDSRIGQIIGSYRLERRLGHGGQGAVYQARHLTIERQVAIKLLLPGSSSAAAERFLREPRLANLVLVDGQPHPNVVAVLDLGVDPESKAVFLVQELLVGETLGAHLRSQPAQRLPWQRVVQLLLPVCDALAAAHAAGVVHRDLKPENIFLHHTQGMILPKVLDFGIAQLADQRITRTGDVIGTPAYMAPECSHGSQVVDARADVWALGLLFYEALTGTRPFAAPPGRLAPQAVHALLGTEMAPFSIPDAPAALRALIRRCLSPQPADRYPDAGALVAALRRLAPGAGPEQPVSTRFGSLLVYAGCALALVGVARGLSSKREHSDGGHPAAVDLNAPVVREAEVAKPPDAKPPDTRVTAEPAELPAVLPGVLIVRSDEGARIRVLTTGSTETAAFERTGEQARVRFTLPPGVHRLQCQSSREERPRYLTVRVRPGEEHVVDCYSD